MVTGSNPTSEASNTDQKPNWKPRLQGQKRKNNKKNGLSPNFERFIDRFFLGNADLVRGNLMA